MTPNRRDLIAAFFAAAAAPAPIAAPMSQQAGESTAIAGKRPMILHSDRPEDLETPGEYYTSWVTPVDSFFVRQHIPRPSKIDPASFKITLNGMVSRPREITLDDLKKLPQYTVPATLECTGNGRGFYSPKVPGIQWKRGAVGNAEWQGPRLSDVLKLAGMNEGAKEIEFDGADTGVAKTPDFVRSMPLTKAMHPATLVAIKMNGDTPQIHGFPARLIVPGWDGTSWVKWVTRITPQEKQTAGFFMNPGYRIPSIPLPPGTPARPAELVVIEGMPVKSSIMIPGDGAKFAVGTIPVRGIAWAGEEAIEHVEVSFDGGAKWQPAELSPQKLHFAWRLWRVDWKPAGPGYYNILSRATDSAGRVQPFVPSWNPSGYLWNGVDRIGVTVEAKA
ncbi:MAG TPA: sulfite oxidase [Bryobacteraceae bacterium]|nr:sulfite oxidase [Bryobacteraceae bacterium]